MTLAVLCLAPLLPWALAHPLSERFATPATALKSMANIAALIGTAAFAVALVLGGRLRVVERLFLGLDRMYRAHRFLGLVATTLVALHVLLIVLSRALLAGTSAWTLFTPGAGWRIFVGVVALAGLLAGLTVTLFVPIRHETFVRVQQSSESYSSSPACTCSSSLAPRRAPAPSPSTWPCLPFWPSWPSPAARCSGGC